MEDGSENTRNRVWDGESDPALESTECLLTAQWKAEGLSTCRPRQRCPRCSGSSLVEHVLERVLQLLLSLATAELGGPRHLNPKTL